MIQKVNNCWRTLRKKLCSLLSKNKKTVWIAIKLVLLIVRIVCKLIDVFYNEDIDN
jgi:hypothetical protein